MTGPPYPHPPYPPSFSSIGQFQIGVSPIGSIAPFDPWATIMSQYANSPALTAMITAFNAAMDTTAFSDNFYDMMWNIQTSQGYGLDVWGRIVGVTRVLSIPGMISYFGFGEAGAAGFGQGSFYQGQQLTTNYVLSDADFRRYIQAKAAANICGGGIPQVNAILLALFPGRGACHVADGLNMSVTYTFSFALSAAEVAIVTNLAQVLTAAGCVINLSHL